MKLVYDEKSMKYIILFENFTKVKVKDAYLREEGIWFVIKEGGLFKAVGKSGIKVKKLESMVKKKIKVIEFNDDICKFSVNLMYPVKPKNVEFNDGNLEIFVEDSKSKGLLIGRERKNLKGLKEVLSRYFEVNNILIK